MAFNFGSIPFVARARPTGGGGIGATYVGDSGTGFTFTNPAPHTAPASLSSGQKYVIAVVQMESAAVATGLTANGTAATQRGSATTIDDGVAVTWWEVTPGSSGTTVSVTFAAGPSRTNLHYWSVTNAATYQTGTATTATSGNTRDVSVNVATGDLVLAVAGGNSATAMTWTGLTEESGGTITTEGMFSSAAKAENVTAATPRTITVDRVGTTNNNEGFGAASVVYR